MNEEQITKFINACKNAGFEVVGTEWHDAFQTRIQISEELVILCTIYSEDDKTFMLHVGGSYEGVKDFKPLIASHLMEAIRKRHRMEVECDDDEVCAWVGPLANSFRRETTADAIFEAFCEVYQ